MTTFSLAPRPRNRGHRNLAHARAIRPAQARMDSKRMSESANMSDERRLLSLIAADLRSRGWAVSMNRTIGLYQVDLFAAAPNGHRLAVELKAFPGSVHFATLTNVAALRSGLAAFGEPRTIPVLLAVGTATTALHELAQRLAVSFVVAPPTNDESATRELFVAHLVETARATFYDTFEPPGLTPERLTGLLDETASKQLAERVDFVRAPEAGLFRAGRRGHIDVYPAPPTRPLLRTSEPMLYGERWSDPLGVFSTAAFSTSPEAAIGRYLARFRRATTAEGRGIVEAITSFLTGSADPGEPPLTEGRVPADVFAEFLLLHVGFDQPPLLVDLDGPGTRAALAEELARLTSPAEVEPTEVDLARTKDRRLTWLAIRALYEACAERSVGPVAGVRYQDAAGPHWDAVVAWSPPTLIPLDGVLAELRPLSPIDPAVERAAEQLSLSLQ